MKLATWVKVIDRKKVDSFEAAIEQDPLDPLTYGIFADYIEESGDRSFIDEEEYTKMLRAIYEKLPQAVEACIAFVQEQAALRPGIGNEEHDFRRFARQDIAYKLYEMIPEMAADGYINSLIARAIYDRIFS